MAINERAAQDARHARTGKDAGIYDGDGNLCASVESFQAKVSYSNAKYTALGDPQEHETANSYGITITMSEIVIEDTAYFQLRTRVEELLSVLEEVDQALLKGRFGLDGRPPMSLEETARDLGLDLEEAAERERRAMLALRCQNG